MDGLEEGSLVNGFLTLTDYLDRLWFDKRGILVFLASAIIYYVTLGSRLDLLLFGIASSLILLPSVPSFSFSLPYDGIARLLINLVFTTILMIFGIWVSSKPSYKSDTPAPPGPIVFIPSRTTHRRFFPQKHSFSYSYLTIGIPVGYRGRVNRILSVDSVGTKSRWSWLSVLYNVDGADYLNRGKHPNGLRGKLDEYLGSQDVDASKYPHAFLVTAPRFLGYHFNPVSFWYLYSEKRQLEAMVLEVNNTFGERHPYLVFRDADGEDKILKHTMKKDFHVSPFNSRQGSYSISARDPLEPEMTAFDGLDVTVNLSSSKGHPKLVARLFGDGDPVDARKMNSTTAILFVFQWCWVGFVTFPRIVKEAAVLFFRRKLHVWYRPEPLEKTLARTATSLESGLEAAFQQYLRFLVHSASRPIRVKYIASGISDSSPQVFTSPSAGEAGNVAEEVEIKILTPSFYARFVHYAHDFEAIFSELTESCTIAVDNRAALPNIFLKKGGLSLHTSSISDFVCFSLIKLLRARPEPIIRPLTSAEQPQVKELTDIRGFRISSMDAYVLEQADASLKMSYRSAVLHQLIASRFFLDVPELLTLTIFGLKATISYLFCRSIQELWV